LRDLGRDLEEQTWQSNLRFWRHRDRRCLANNRHYHRIRSHGVAGSAVRDLDVDALAQLMADPDEPFHRAGVVVLKNSRSSTVVEFDMPVQGRIQRVIYKRFRVTSKQDPWLALLRRSPALRSWVHGHGLRERCLTTARPLAVWHRRRGPLVYEGYLLTEKIPNAVDLHAFLHSLTRVHETQARETLRRRLEQVARMVRELHRRQLAHRDLKAANILLADDRVWLIDLVGIKRLRRLSEVRRIRNLARLNASFHCSAQLTRSDRLRFLRTYLQWGLFGKGGWKKWWRALAEATQAKIVRNLQSGRPLA
jgi:hypothetical protein